MRLEAIVIKLLGSLKSFSGQTDDLAPLIGSFRTLRFSIHQCLRAISPSRGSSCGA